MECRKSRQQTEDGSDEFTCGIKKILNKGMYMKNKLLIIVDFPYFREIKNNLVRFFKISGIWFILFIFQALVSFLTE